MLPTADTIGVLPPQTLRDHCRQRATDNRHEVFCFELFRRAIVARDQICWEHICETYQPLVYSWLKQQAPTGTIGNTLLSELLFCPFAKLWQSYTPVRLAAAKELASILAYLRTCVISCIQDERRVQQRRRAREEQSLDAVEPASAGTAAEAALQNIWKEHLWTALAQSCKDEREHLVLRLTLTTNLKPNEIFELHPTLFQDVNDVYNVKRNLLARWKRDNTIHALWQERPLS